MTQTTDRPLQTISTLAELVAAAQALLAAHGDMPLAIDMAESVHDNTRYFDSRVIYEPCKIGAECVLMFEA